MKKLKKFWKRFKNWKLPSKASFIGCLVAILALVIYFYDSCNKKPEVEGLYHNAKAAFDRGDLNKAMKLFEELYKKNPHFPGGAYHFAQLLLSSNQVDKASEVVSFIPRTDTFRYKEFFTGLVYYLNGQFNKALIHLKEFLNNFSFTSDYMYWIAKYYMFKLNNQNSNNDIFYKNAKTLCEILENEILDLRNTTVLVNKMKLFDKNKMFLQIEMEVIAFKLLTEAGQQFLLDGESQKSLDAFGGAFTFMNSPMELNLLPLRVSKDYFLCNLTKISEAFTNLHQAVNPKKRLNEVLIRKFSKLFTSLENKNTDSNILDFCKLWKKIYVERNKDINIEDNGLKLCFSLNLNLNNKTENNKFKKAYLASSSFIGIINDELAKNDFSYSKKFTKTIDKGLKIDEEIYFNIIIELNSGKQIFIPLYPIIKYNCDNNWETFFGIDLLNKVSDRK